MKLRIFAVAGLVTLIAAMLTLTIGCTITGPKGTYSIAVNSEQIGFARDLVTQLANVYQDIEAQKAALEEAEKQGKTDRVASILDKLDNLRKKQQSLTEKVEAQNDAAEHVLTIEELPVNSP